MEDQKQSTSDAAAGTKQGDKLSPLLFGILFNALLLELKVTGVGHRTISNLRTSLLFRRPSSRGRLSCGPATSLRSDF